MHTLESIFGFIFSRSSQFFGQIRAGIIGGHRSDAFSVFPVALLLHQWSYTHDLSMVLLPSLWATICTRPSLCSSFINTEVLATWAFQCISVTYTVRPSRSEAVTVYTRLTETDTKRTLIPHYQLKMLFLSISQSLTKMDHFLVGPKLWVSIARRLLKGLRVANAISLKFWSRSHQTRFVCIPQMISIPQIGSDKLKVEFFCNQNIRISSECRWKVFIENFSSKTWVIVA